MKIYTIIGGVNGVGKSSLTGVLKSEVNDLGVVIDVDKITADYGNNKIKGAKSAIAKMEKCLESGISFTQETTLSGARTLKTISRAIALGYKIRLYYVGLDSVEESYERITNRVKKGGHGISSEDVERRFENRFTALSAVLPYCNEVSFFDNFNGFVEVAEYKNGELILKGAYRPKWITELDIYLKSV